LSSSRPIGLVLSGGGARGAYEVGVLLHVAEELPGLLDRVRVMTGASVGAVNSAYLASHGLTVESVRALADIWRTLDIDQLVAIDKDGLRDLLAAGGKRLIGRPVESPPVGLLRVDGIANIVREQADWHNLARVVRRGRFDAVGFAATDIASGSTHFFVDHRSSITPRWSRGDDAPTPIRTVLGPAHVLASAAIPLLFPPVEVTGRWYMDGGVRYNTPLAPALGLGAESLFIVSVRAAPDTHRDAPEGTFSGFGQIVGKVLDSVFLDRVGFDLDRLTRINHMVAAVEEAGGPTLLAAMHDQLLAKGRPRYREVDTAHIRPTHDLGALAASHLEAANHSRPFSFARVLRALFQDDTGTTGDAASFLLFDGGYAGTLIEVGRKDAADAHAALERL
jgi:NTE family protein